MDSNKLLEKVFYGYEIVDLKRSCFGLEKSLKLHVQSGFSIDYEILKAVLDDFYKIQYSGIFGGQITAGDAVFIYCMMNAIKPSSMIEFGVASGFSSASILYFADKLKLLTNETYLTSFDLDDGSLSGKEVGSFVKAYYPEYQRFWNFFPGKTSLDLALDSRSYLTDNLISGKQSLVFVDAGHNHPWPGVDLISLYRYFNKEGLQDTSCGTWVMLQDVRMMERWVMDCVRFKVQSPPPIRGVEHAYALWPGKKFSGINMCFNMAAINLNVSGADIASYYKELLNYDFECNISRE